MYNWLIAECNLLRWCHLKVCYMYYMAIRLFSLSLSLSLSLSCKFLIAISLIASAKNWCCLLHNSSYNTLMFEHDSCGHVVSMISLRARKRKRRWVKRGSSLYQTLWISSTLPACWAAEQTLNFVMGFGPLWRYKIRRFVWCWRFILASIYHSPLSR